jgi:hypothetical protein
MTLLGWNGSSQHNISGKISIRIPEARFANLIGSASINRASFDAESATVSTLLLRANQLASSAQLPE